MRPIVFNIHLLLLLASYVMRRAGTFSFEEKVKMLEFLSRVACNPDDSKNLKGLLSVKTNPTYTRRGCVYVHQRVF